MHDTITSKKLWFAVGVILIALVYSVLAASKFPELKGLFDGFTGFLEFVTGAYLTGNLANKVIAGKLQPLDSIPNIVADVKTVVAQATNPLDKDVPSGK